MLSIGRMEANENFLNMPREKLELICLAYNKAIYACGKAVATRSIKRRIIKEYERLKNTLPRELVHQDMENITFLLETARCVGNDTDVRKLAYRKAIRHTVSLEEKNKLKEEYNFFLISLKTPLF